MLSYLLVKAIFVPFRQNFSGSEFTMELKQGKELTFEEEGVSVVLRHRGPIPLERPEIKEEILRKLVK